MTATSESHNGTYFTPEIVTPPQTAMVAGQAVATPYYVLIPPTVLNDLVASTIPGWADTRFWVLAAPSFGHQARISQCLAYVEDGGGSDAAEIEDGVESFLFVLEGNARLTVSGGGSHAMRPGGFAFLPAHQQWGLRAVDGQARLIWLRKAYEEYAGPPPKLLVGNEHDLPTTQSPLSPRKWTTRLIPVDDVAYDFHMNVVAFSPGSIIPFAETHVMEHGLYMLEGKGTYLLNERWHEVGPGSYIWMRPFCPQAFYAAGDTPSRYLLYKNMNRQFLLTK